MTVQTATRKKVTSTRRKINRDGPFTRDDLDAMLDALALHIEVSSAPAKLLPLFERIEREIATLEDDGEILRRALKRSKKAKRGFR